MAAKKKRTKKSAKKTTRKKACRCAKGWRKKGAKSCTKGKRVMPLACAFPRKKRGTGKRARRKAALADVLPVPEYGRTLQPGWGY